MQDLASEKGGEAGVREQRLIKSVDQFVSDYLRSMERSCRRRCRCADNYDSGGRTLVSVIFGSCLGFGIDSRFRHFSFRAEWDGRV